MLVNHGENLIVDQETLGMGLIPSIPSQFKLIS